MKKKYLAMLCAVTVTVSMMTCGGTVFAEENTAAGAMQQEVQAESETEILLSDEGITVNGEQISSNASDAVYGGAQIVYYKSGQDALYGEGDEEDGHTEEEAAEHTVITITAPGTYRVKGSISKGQIAIDLGEDSREDESAVVNLILDQAEINCSVAPAIVVYNAYECGSDDEETATKDVDTTNGGFHLILADGSENTVNGSYVAKIYKEGMTQEEVDAGEAKKQWKFDAAIDSLVSFEIDGEEEKDGVLKVTAENEGISSGLHMTINGGTVDIHSGDDAINTSEDGVSVFTVNDGTLICNSNLGKEGDGIDSNGWIVLNGGSVTSYANPDSQDSRVDSDLGIYVNGGTLLSGGNMYDEISEDSEQPFLVLSFQEQAEGGQLLMLKDSTEEPIAAFGAENQFTTLVYSSDLLTDGEDTLYKVSSVDGELDGNIYTNIISYEDAVQLQYSTTGMMGPGGGQGERPEMSEGMEMGERPEKPEGMENGERPEKPEGMENGERPELPEGMEKGMGPGGANAEQESGEPSSVFTISGVRNIFSQITEAE